MSTEFTTTKNVNIDILSPMMKEIYDYMQQYPDDLVVTRVGDFFEAYFEDAITLHKVTDIRLTSKVIGKDGDRLSIPMAGVPHRSISDYAVKVVNDKRRMVIIEQLEDPATVKGRLVKRGVVRIVTSSTLVDDGFIDEYINNYLCVINKVQGVYGLCFSDISTGEIYMTSQDSVEGVLNELSRYKPSEILLDTECLMLFEDLVEKRLKLGLTFTVKDAFFKAKNIYEKIEKSFNIESIDKIKFNHVSELNSLYALLTYVEYTQCINVNYGSLPESYNTASFLVFDMDTRRNLELCENLSDRRKNGTLFSVLDKTSTVMGSRLLRQWLEKPLVSKAKIELRLAGVEELLINNEVSKSMSNALGGISDISRIMGRLKLNRSIPRDLVALRESLKRLPTIKRELSKLSSPLLLELNNNFETFEDLCYLLEQSICDEPIADIREGIVIKSGYNKKLDSIREMISNSNNYLMELEEKERESTGIKNLKVVNVNGLHTIEVSRASGNKEKTPSYYIFEKEMKNSIRYTTEELKKIEAELLTSSEKSKNLEIELYEEIKSLVLLKLKEVGILCDIISTLDVLCSMAKVAKDNNYIKPKLNIEGNLVIKDGRHPVVEKLLKNEVFVSNDITMDMSSNRYLLITGPNMAGKSTYMRQVALITIMAHIGSFVPATYADISITDKIFTRIGASDDIASGRSTYMVEMEEVCNILRNSTSKSLVILDEVGRGTSTTDGLSIAQAITEYIHNVIGCKTLFATHYHELIALESNLLGLKNYHLSVGRTEDNNLVFLRKIEKGGLSDSYGVDVAKLAGIPDEVIDRAWEILNKIEGREVEVKVSKNSAAENILAELRNIDIADINPVSSYKYMVDLVKKVQEL